MNSEPTPFQSPYQGSNPTPSKKKPPVWLFLLLGCGGCMVLMVPIMAAILFPVFAQARSKAQAMSCMSNVKQNCLGTLMYIEDYDETLPPTKAWMEITDPYVKNPATRHCPEVKAHTSDETANYGYAFNSDLSNKTLGKAGQPWTTMMIYDSSTLTRDATDPGTSLDLSRHNHTGIVGYLDGHAKALSQDGESGTTQSN